MARGSRLDHATAGDAEIDSDLEVRVCDVVCTMNVFNGNGDYEVFKRGLQGWYVGEPYLN